MDNECPCKEPGFCEEYKSELTGRLYDICRGYDDKGDEVLNAEMRAKYRKLWKDKASQLTAEKIQGIRSAAQTRRNCGCGKMKLRAK